MGDNNKGSALLTGALSALPVVGGVASTLLQNSNNIKLAREQREWDYRMWKENNEYNTPQNQVARLRAAGINPALALTNGSLSSGVSSSPSGGQTAPVTDFSPIASGMRDSVELFQQKRLQDAQIDSLNAQTMNQSIRNRFENQKQILELQQMLENKGLTSAQRRHLMVDIQRLSKENEWIDKRNSSQIAKNDADAAKAHAEVSYFELLSEGQRIANQFAPVHQKAILNEISAHITSLMAAANDSNEHAAYNIAMTALSNAQKNGAEIDNNTKRRMANALVNKAFSEANTSSSNARIAGHAATYGTWSTKFFGSKHDNNVRQLSGGVR